MFRALSHYNLKHLSDSGYKFVFAISIFIRGTPEGALLIAVCSPVLAIPAALAMAGLDNCWAQPMEERTWKEFDMSALQTWKTPCGGTVLYHRFYPQVLVDQNPGGVVGQVQMNTSLPKLK